MGRFNRSSRPYWLNARFGGKCSRCGLGIKKGEQAFYYPATKVILCQREPCGQQAARELAADDHDQAVMNYQP
jgi:hypothetical protein